MHGLGIAYVDLGGAKTSGRISSTVTHEIAHAVGYTDRKNLRKADDRFASHCDNQFCVMYPEVGILSVGFCGVCKDGIKETINRKLFDLASRRVVTRQVPKFIQ